MNSIKELPVNPFSDRFVTNPRDSGAIVESLNETALNRLLVSFDQVESTRKTLVAQLITSKAPGYGKSHLISRLFKRLGGRANRIYIQPFIDYSNSWRSFLLTVIKELTLSEDPMRIHCERGEKDQLDALAQAVLSKLIAQAFANGILHHPDTEGARAMFEACKVDLGNKEDLWAQWFRRDFEKLENKLVDCLKQKNVAINNNLSPKVYLRVLFHYCTDRDDVERRQICVEWLKGKCLEADDTKKIGLQQYDAVSVDSPPETVNETCKYRIIDLCNLSALYRPFLFCFDQTEMFARSAELSFEFGTLFAELFQNAQNQLTVITANAAIWQKMTVDEGYIDLAHQERLSRPIEMEGINQEQAEQLARLRLEEIGLEDASINRFLDKEWLNESFGMGMQSVRSFLKDCEERLDQVRDVPPAPPESLDEIFEKSRQNLLRESRKLIHHEDKLLWAFLEIVGKSNNQLRFTAQRLKSKNQYFPIAWICSDSGRKIIFCFEEGHNAMRWKAIVSEAERLLTREREGSIAISVRGPELSQIPPPPPKWPQIRPLIQKSIQTGNFRFELLDETGLANLYTGFELYSSSCQKDISYSPEQVLSYLRGKFSDYWESLVCRKEEPVTAKHQPAEQTHERDELARIVKEIRFIDCDELIEALSKKGISLNQDDVVKISGTIENIKIFPHPNNAAFRWKH